jgi:hypothetical protein
MSGRVSCPLGTHTSTLSDPSVQPYRLARLTTVGEPGGRSILNQCRLYAVIGCRRLIAALGAVGPTPAARAESEAGLVMLGMDGPWDDRRDASDGAPDTPRPENTVPSAGRGHFLTDARTRQECAPAYRVTVDAVYAKEALHAGALRAGDDQSSDSAEAERPDMADRHPTRYTRSADPPPRVEGPGEHPAPGHWFNAVNHEGSVLAVDGQAALFEEWPPSKDGLGFDESGMSFSDAVYFTADGKVARNDHE